MCLFFFFSSRRRHTRLVSDWSSDVCSSDLDPWPGGEPPDPDDLDAACDLLLRGARYDDADERTTLYLFLALRDRQHRSEERRVGKECGSRRSPERSRDSGAT